MSDLLSNFIATALISETMIFVISNQFLKCITVTPGYLQGTNLCNLFHFTGYNNLVFFNVEILIILTSTLNWYNVLGTCTLYIQCMLNGLRINILNSCTYE